MFPSSYPSQAGAGRVIVDKGKIYFSTGYAEIPTKLDGAAVPAAQNPNSSFGKIFVIDPATQKVHLLSLGFRNAQGLAVLGQDLLATEQGPEGGDEINLIREGKNYGWLLYNLWDRTMAPMITSRKCHRQNAS